MKISLLPGWGLGLAPLQLLADSLSRQHEVQLLPLPDCTSLEQALDTLDARIPPDSWLAGWSLGGMLATALAHRRGGRCPGLIALASNACFVARDDWPQAMAPAMFRAFTRRAGHDLNSTLASFVQLCVQGEQATAKQVRQLATGAGTTTHSTAQASLAWLAQLDNRTVLREVQCPHLHLLARQDALVPAAVADAIVALAPQAQVEVLPGSHAWVWSRHRQVAARMLDFIQCRRQEQP